MPENTLIKNIVQLLQKWDMLVDEVASKGDEMIVVSHATYYYGAIFGLEKAREELTALLATHLAKQVVHDEDR